MAATKANKITVAVITHAAYLKYLPDVIQSIENQTVKPRQKILVYDGDASELPPAETVAPKDWTVICMKAGKPNPLRNKAITESETSWIVFADGDDVMDPGYIESLNDIIGKKDVDPKLAFVYSDLDYSDGNHLPTPPEFDYWHLRRGNYVSSTACWNKAAIKKVGGWSELTKCYDDWSLALDVTRAGYVGVKGQGVIQVNNHGKDHRRTLTSDTKNKQFPHFWLHRDYSVVTLFAGRPQFLDKYFQWIRTEAEAKRLPPDITFVAVDNSRDPEFAKQLQHHQTDIADLVTCRYIQDNQEAAPEDRHSIVADLYSHHLPGINSDMLVLWEDDVLPPPAALKDLVKSWNNHHKPGGIAGVYLSRHNKARKWGLKSYIVASNNPNYWAVDLNLNDVLRYRAQHKDRLMRVRQIAGGFTVFNNAAIKAALPLRHGPHGSTGQVIGWDSDFSFKSDKLGFNCYLHPSVMCDHFYRH